ncbi:MAG: transposase [Bacteroidota bacterium]
MKYKQRKQYRLPHYNYASSGLYFVTICSYNRENIFSEVKQGNIHLLTVGEYILECLTNLPEKLSYVRIDEFVIMPNHIHVIFGIDNPGEDVSIKTMKFQPEKKSLSIVVRNFKSTVTLLSRENYPEMKIWQSRFYDRIIRSEQELQNVRKYIQDNPLRWEADKNNPENMMM